MSDLRRRITICVRTEILSSGCGYYVRERELKERKKSQSNMKEM